MGGSNALDVDHILYMERLSGLRQPLAGPCPVAVQAAGTVVKRSPDVERPTRAGFCRGNHAQTSPGEIATAVTPGALPADEQRRCPRPDVSADAG